MMMQYRHRNNYQNKWGTSVIVVGVLVVFFVGDWLTGYRATSFIRSLLAPSFSSVHSVLYPDSLKRFFADREQLVQENDRLFKKVQELEGDLIVAQSKIVDLQQQGSGVIPASVLKKTPHVGRVISYVGYPFGELTILFSDTSFTPTEKSLVYTTSGAVLGTVIRADTKTAIVGLLSKSGEKHTMRIGSEVLADVYGKGGVTMYAEVPKNSVVNVGDVVTLPEAEGSPVGVVGEVTLSETDIVQYVLIRLTVNPQSVSFLTVYE
jgi:hypothetical protein